MFVKTLEILQELRRSGLHGTGASVAVCDGAGEVVVCVLLLYPPVCLPSRGHLAKHFYTSIILGTPAKSQKNVEQELS